MTDDGAPLTPRRRLLARLSAAVASGGDDGIARVLDRAAEAVREDEVEQREVEETLLQTHLFLGYPAALSAMRAWRERTPAPPPERDPLAEPADVAAWRERGEEVCRRVYGGAYPTLRRSVRELHPALDRWAVTGGYGKVLGRPGLPLVDRELCIAAVLAVRGRRPQLHSHLRGALRAGATAPAVDAVLELALEAAGPSEREDAREVWSEVRRRAGADGGEEGAGRAADGIPEGA